MTVGNKTVVDAVFADTGSDVFLDGPKRPQGNSVAAETAASVADSVEMTGISVNGIDRILEEDVVRAEYGLGANAPRSVYRTVERPGEDSDAIVKYLNGYDEDDRHISGYLDNLGVLYSEYPLAGTIIGEQTELAFIKLFGSILRQRNILTAFDQFSNDDPITERDLQDYQGVYIDLYRKIQEKRKGTERADIKDDIVFEIELVKQVEVNIDYILELIVKYHKDNCRDKEILVNVERAINSSLELRNKRELIMTFINKVDPGTDVVQEWATFVDQEMKNELELMIAENKLKPEETRTSI